MDLHRGHGSKEAHCKAAMEMTRFIFRGLQHSGHEVHACIRVFIQGPLGVPPHSELKWSFYALGYLLHSNTGWSADKRNGNITLGFSVPKNATNVSRW